MYFGDDLGVQIRAKAAELGSAGRRIAVVTDRNVQGGQAPRSKPFSAPPRPGRLPRGRSRSRWRNSAESSISWPNCGWTARGSCSPSAAALSAIWPDLRRRAICAESIIFRCPRRFWPWSTARSAGRPASISGRGRTSREPSTSRGACWSRRAFWRLCLPANLRLGWRK